MLKNIYESSPLWLQNLFISAYGYKLLKQRYGKVYFNSRENYLRKSYENRDEEEYFQFLELKKFIDYAYQNSVFYQKLYEDFDLSKIESIDDLSLLPILEKEEFRLNIDSIYTVSETESIPSFTGGTTGKAIKVLFTKEDFQKRMAYLDAFKMKIGVDPFKSKKATFSGRQFTKPGTSEVFWRYNRAYNQKLYSTFDLTEENMSFYVEDLNQFKPEVINGFVSAIYEIAKYIETEHLTLEFSPKAIFTTSETLLVHHRELIERVFKSKIYNQYASAEGAPFVTECKEGNLHYNLDTGVIEFIETPYGNEILVTSFTTHGTPLIRYRIGDKIELSNKIDCKCGSSHPIVEKIEGRQVEFLISVDGKKVSLSHLADVIKGLPNNVKKMQFVQEQKDVIKIKLIVDAGSYHQKDEDSIVNEMHYRFGASMTIIFEYVESIPREKSGKFALIKNKLV